MTRRVGDVNWGGILTVLLTIAGTAVSAFIGLLVARTNRDSNTAGKRIDASATELATVSQLVGSLSEENRKQREEMERHRAAQERADVEQRKLNSTIINVQQALLDVNTKVERQTALLYAIDQEARRRYPHEWAAILAAVVPTHRDAYLLIVPAPEPPASSLPPEPDPATDPQN